MSAMDILEYDHRIIVDACAVANRVVDGLIANGHCPTGKLRQLTGFFRTFVDDCHNLKEERVLFAHLLKRNMGLFLGPITTLTSDHQKRRKLMDHMETLLNGDATVSGDAAGTIAESLAKYVSLTQSHLRTENESLYPMIVQMLPPAQMEPLAQEFLRIEQEALHGEPVEQLLRRLQA